MTRVVSEYINQQTCDAVVTTSYNSILNMFCSSALCCEGANIVDIPNTMTKIFCEGTLCGS